LSLIVIIYTHRRCKQWERGRSGSSSFFC